MDIRSLDKLDGYPEPGEAMFFYADPADAPWTVAKSNDKEIAGKPDGKITGPPALLSEQMPFQPFARL